MNYMEQVAQMLGVELYEDFKVVNYDDYIFKITDDGLRCKGYDGWHREVFTFDDILCGRTEIIKKPILDEVEKEYLKAVIKPFRDTVKTIIKIDLNHEGVCEFIRIDHDEYDSRLLGTINLPNFKKGTMYKGMEVNKEYTLEDLGL